VPDDAVHQDHGAWGIQRGWGADVSEFGDVSFRLKLGTYTMTETITAPFRKALDLPDSFGLGEGNCGEATALWTHERLPLGWGDTYTQSLDGQNFNVTDLPNGTYYIEVIANPEKVLRETDMANNISLRKIILGGTPDHRTLRVPPFTA
jgi:hypothetical protein